MTSNTSLTKYLFVLQTSRLLDPATYVSEFDRRIIEADAPSNIDRSASGKIVIIGV